MNEQVSLWRTRILDFEYGLLVPSRATADCPTRVLTALSVDPNPDVRVHVACHARTPASTMLDMTSDPDVMVRRALALNQALPSRAATALAADLDPLVRRDLATRIPVPAGVARTLAADLHVEVRAALADNPSTRPGPLDVLARDSDDHVRLLVAAHLAARPATLRLLAHDPVSSVVLQVIVNPVTPLKILVALSRDELAAGDRLGYASCYLSVRVGDLVGPHLSAPVMAELLRARTPADDLLPTLAARVLSLPPEQQAVLAELHDRMPASTSLEEAIAAAQEVCLDQRDMPALDLPAAQLALS